MKYSYWLSLIVFLTTVQVGQLDPGDDFSYGLHRLPTVRSSDSKGIDGALSVRQIEAILAERLVSFPSAQVSSLAHHLFDLCYRYRFDPAFILSVIDVESSFRVDATSPAGALGLMQLMPATANVVVRDMSLPLDSSTLKLLKAGQSIKNRLQVLSRPLLMDPFINLTLGVAYLAFLRERYRALHPYYLIAAYNMGPARMDELMSRKGFKPDKSKKYYDAIRQSVTQFRSHRQTI